MSVLFTWLFRRPSQLGVQANGDAAGGFRSDAKTVWFPWAGVLSTALSTRGRERARDHPSAAVLYCGTPPGRFSRLPRPRSAPSPVLASCGCDVPAAVAAARMTKVILGLREPAELGHNLDWITHMTPFHFG
jgi:hypothetical protein